MGKKPETIAHLIDQESIANAAFDADALVFLHVALGGKFKTQNSLQIGARQLVFIPDHSKFHSVRYASRSRKTDTIKPVMLFASPARFQRRHHGIGS